MHSESFAKCQRIVSDSSPAVASHAPDTGENSKF